MSGHPTLPSKASIFNRFSKRPSSRLLSQRKLTDGSVLPPYSFNPTVNNSVCIIVASVSRHCTVGKTGPKCAEQKSTDKYVYMQSTQEVPWDGGKKRPCKLSLCPYQATEYELYLCLVRWVSRTPGDLAVSIVNATDPLVYICGAPSLWPLSRVQVAVPFVEDTICLTLQKRCDVHTLVDVTPLFCNVLAGSAYLTPAHRSTYQTNGPSPSPVTNAVRQLFYCISVHVKSEMLSGRSHWTSLRMHSW